jgi:hypothetical protein
MTQRIRGWRRGAVVGAPRLAAAGRAGQELPQGPARRGSVQGSPQPVPAPAATVAGAADAKPGKPVTPSASRPAWYRLFSPNGPMTPRELCMALMDSGASSACLAAQADVAAARNSPATGLRHPARGHWCAGRIRGGRIGGTSGWRGLPRGCRCRHCLDLRRARRAGALCGRMVLYRTCYRVLRCGRCHGDPCARRSSCGLLRACGVRRRRTRWVESAAQCMWPSQRPTRTARPDARRHGGIS